MEHFPVWIGEEGHKLYCDQVRLEQFLSTVLNYSEADAAKLSQRLARRLARGRSIDDFWSKASFRKTTTDVVRVLLRSIDPNSLPTLLGYQDRYGQTALFQFAFYKRHEVVKLMLDSLETEEERFNTLTITTKVSERTPLHISCWRSDIESVKAILDHVNPLQRYDLMKMQTINGNIPLHCAAYCGVTAMLKYLYQSVTKSQWDNLLHMDDHYGLTILHKAAYGGVKTVMKVIKETVSSDTFIRLVSTPLPPWERVKYICRPGKYKQCSENWTVARIEEAIHTENQQDKAQQIERITETEPLSIEQIGVLSPHSIKYVIPYNQTKSKRYGLIIFNPHNRPRAAEEADYLKQSLENAEFDVLIIQWSDSEELHKEIQQALTDLAADCSLLFVCIMAHGSRGQLAGSTGAPIAINDVLQQLTERLPKTLPVVVVIQACQSTPHVHDQASIQTIDHRRIQHIELLRPNTVLFLASVRGGLALRGALTGAVADVLQAADGATDISAMFDNAARVVLGNADCKRIHQLPELRKTTSKLLILPATSAQDTNEYHQPASSCVPQAQTRGRMYALILYCTTGRVGAEEEADTLSQSLEVIGCEVWQMEWYDTSELVLMIESSLQRIAEAGDCSMLIVSLMCHGGEGNLVGASGNEVPVNSVLQLLSSSLDPSIILVTLIQACQVMSSSDVSDEDSEFDPIAVQASDPDYDKHITLLRPNSVLLLATTRGGKAKRGAFIQAIADELKAMDGAQDICKIFDLAVGKMFKDRHCMKIGQCPELRKTPCKSQIISRAEC